MRACALRYAGLARCRSGWTDIRSFYLMLMLMLTWAAAAAAAVDGAVAGEWTLHKMTDAATKTGAVCLVRVVEAATSLFPNTYMLVSNTCLSAYAALQDCIGGTLLPPL